MFDVDDLLASLDKSPILDSLYHLLQESNTHMIM